MIPKITRLILTIGTCLLAHSAAAQEQERSWHLGIALGQGSRENPLISGEDIDINAVIDFSWYGDKFFFDNGDLGFTFLEQRNYSFSLIATINNERNFYNYLTGRQLSLDSLLDNKFGFGSSLTGPSDATTVIDPGTGKPEILPADPDVIQIASDPAQQNRDVALPDRDFALNSGVEFLYVSPMGDIQAQVLTDISSVHDGQEAWLSWSYPWFTHNGQFNLTLGAEWKSGDLATYYYGVTPEESFTGRPAYETGSGTNTFIRFSARHALTEHWHIAGVVEREFLSYAIRNSPIVDASHVDTWFLGLYYSF
jgi:outer membrane protein